MTNQLLPAVLADPPGRQRYVFPAIGGGGRPLSENTLNGAIRRLGYSGEEMTAHGFRTMASTLLNEQGVHPDLIELQLAHAERNTVRAAYNRAQRLAERREMMQKWADYLDCLRRNASDRQHIVGNADGWKVDEAQDKIVSY